MIGREIFDRIDRIDRIEAAGWTGYEQSAMRS
jgi:hypothetical protein